MQITPMCDLYCMVVTEQRPFPRKRVQDNYNTVIHCPSLSRKKTNLRSLLREMAIYEIIVWEAEMPLTGHSRVVQNRSPSDNPVTQKCVFRNCSYKETAS